MPEIDPLAVTVATAAAFLAGGAYYAVLGERLAQLGEAAAAAGPQAYVLAVEVLRCLVLTTVVAGLAAQGDIDTLAGGLLLAAALWVGFPLVLWSGAIVHARTPVGLAAIHAGDWLVKLLLVAAIVSVVQ
jgi:Protein of unknown function (DUF1761)